MFTWRRIPNIKKKAQPTTTTTHLVRETLQVDSPGDVVHSILPHLGPVENTTALERFKKIEERTASLPLDASRRARERETPALLSRLQNLSLALCHSPWELKIVRHESDVISVFPTTRSAQGETDKQRAEARGNFIGSRRRR